MSRRNPSIHDVAKVAGVSAQTVSRVLNHHPNVSSRTHALVTAAMADLGYQPNHAARSLRGASRILGVLTLGSDLYGPAAALYGIEAAAARSGYEVAVVNLVGSSETDIRTGVQRLRSLGVAGVVAILPLVSDMGALEPLVEGLPVVLVRGPGAEASLSLVGVDNVGGARVATEHLLSLGHDTVWHVGGPEDWQDARSREEGWRTALEARGAQAPPPLRGVWDARSGYDAGRLLAQIGRATAVFVANDQMALGVILALAEHGLEVPGDVSVVGFDDIPEAAFFRPPLTTVRHDLAEVGRRCVATLLGRIGNDDAAAAPDAVVPADLVVRSSTGTPSASPRP